jgi:hypothetical protein
MPDIMSRRFRIARENRHGCARASQAQRHCAADSAVATGHHGDTATQVKKRTVVSHLASREITITSIVRDATVSQGYRKPSGERQRGASPLARF